MNAMFDTVGMEKGRRYEQVGIFRSVCVQLQVKVRQCGAVDGACAVAPILVRARWSF